ncbi:hypothetical protein PACTADRAFT_47449 [Pachysolen tannophilus NRRL Y-2460]|uniref:rRNA-processing protein n=1 Tax=Pachysolen tannophilus NRRL Y-2460 TaxID=669874 RepID=A0A1E4U0M9_PACTA|nr:hypothetical protein PACTADRAFT_47449 [Pachysolen tannophilus NRRL Y-2460]
MSPAESVLKKSISSKYTNPLAPKELTQGSRTNGKDFKISKDAFRVKSIGVKSPYAKREEKRLADKAVRDKLKELKEEKKNETKTRIENLKKRREIKEEKERYEKLAAKMHAKKIERMKRKEKRNKMLKERKSGNK